MLADQTSDCVDGDDGGCLERRRLERPHIEPGERVRRRGVVQGGQWERQKGPPCHAAMMSYKK